MSTIQSQTIYRYQLPLTDLKVYRPLRNIYSTDYLKDYASEMAIKYGLSTIQEKEMMSIIQCESGFQVDPPHNNPCRGIAQFQKGTWLEFGKGDIMNPENQIETMTKMVKDGLMNRWECAKILGFAK